MVAMRVDAARRAALLNRLQKLPDGFAVVIGGAARRARIIEEHRTIGALARVEGGLVESGRRLRRHVGDVVSLRGEFGFASVVGIADVQGFLNGRKRNFSRVFDLFGIVRHVRALILLMRTASGEPSANAPRRLRNWRHAPCGAKTRPKRPLVRSHPVNILLACADPNEMAAINTILIIVNSAKR